MLEVSDITYRYRRDDVPAVRGVSLSVRPGEAVAIVGPNGSGKSTIGRLMKGLLLPTLGAVTVDSLDTRRNPLEVRQTVGLVFQNPNSQIVNSIVEQEIAFGPENLGLPPSEIRDRVVRALHAVGLAGQESAECHGLTMANKQRVAVGSVLAMEPRYLILDEPTAWLEPASRRALLQEVGRWCRAAGAALILITHRMDEAQACDRIYGMLDGKLEAAGTPDQVLLDPGVRQRLALDVPEALELASELAAAGVPVPAEPTVELLAEALCPS